MPSDAVRDAVIAAAREMVEDGLIECDEGLYGGPTPCGNCTACALVDALRALDMDRDGEPSLPEREAARLREAWGDLAPRPETPEPTEPPAGMVRVRIAVAVLDGERWCAHARRSRVDDGAADADVALCGVSASPVGRGSARLSWVEAWVPRPEAAAVIEGEVRDGE